MMSSIIGRNIYQGLVANLALEIKNFYGSRLVTFAIFGSYARNSMTRDSDLDLVIVAENLPKGRMSRSSEFLQIEKNLAPHLDDLARNEIHPYLSPIYKTPEEVQSGSPLFLDMTEEIEILFDRNHFFRSFLEGFKMRLKELGARRVWKGEMWYWDLKPDRKPGEIITL